MVARRSWKIVCQLPVGRTAKAGTARAPGRRLKPVTTCRRCDDTIDVPLRPSPIQRAARSGWRHWQMVPARVEGRGGFGQVQSETKETASYQRPERIEQSSVRESTCTRIASLESILGSMRGASVARERHCPSECGRFTRQARDRRNRSTRHRKQAHLPPLGVRVV